MISQQKDGFFARIACAIVIAKIIYIYFFFLYYFRLSRARRLVENAFGMLATRFRVFLTSINLQPEIVQKLVLASCILHNLLRDYNPGDYRLPDPDATNSDDWSQNPLDGLEARQRQTGTVAAKTVRDYLTEYYNRRAHRLPWQR